MAPISKINPFMQSYQTQPTRSISGERKPEEMNGNPSLFAMGFTGTRPVEPIGEEAKGAGGVRSATTKVDPAFTQSVERFAQKTNPFAGEKLAFEGAKDNYMNGLSPMQQGALGEEQAIYAGNARLGKDFNLIA